MADLKNSANYVWCTSSAYGKGATGIVYQGVHKETGDLVAVKEFHHQNNLRSWDIPRREFEVMKKLCHENIVKMLAIEEEVESHHKVIVMELCTGGSLYTILDDPQNSYGLEEGEFLCVFKDITAGMKYLRDNSIIHRDLKPGNLMKYISEDGRSIYKLTDFGDARDLDDDQEFMSYIHGTEEYLYPDMYERAVLKSPANTSFKATVDLWSIGVTLYHVATGSLPFRPFGGRKNRDTMHYITTKKASGVISGVQHTERGPIVWSKELPETCLLSQELRVLLTVLLAGILECNEEKMWTYNQYFEYAANITSRKVFHVFYSNQGKEFCLYMEPKEMLKDLKERIYIWSKVPSSNQLLLFDKSLFTSQINPLLNVSTFPSTTIDQPLILVHVDNATRLHFPEPPPMTNTDNLAKMAKMHCSIAHAEKRLVVKIVRCQELLLKIPKILISLTEDSIKKLCSDSGVLLERIGDVTNRTNFLEKSYSLLLERVSCPNVKVYKNELQRISGIVSEQKKFKNTIAENATQLQSSINLLKAAVFVSKRPQTEWKEALSECSSLTGSVERADTFVKRIHNSWQVFVRESRGYVVNYKLQALEKVKLQKSREKLTLLRKECLKSCLQASEKLFEWHSGMCEVFVKSQYFGKEIESASSNLKNFYSSLQKVESEVCGMGEKIVPLLKNDKITSSQIQALKQDNKYLSRCIEKQNRLKKKLEKLSLWCKYDMDNSN